MKLPHSSKINLQRSQTIYSWSYLGKWNRFKFNFAFTFLSILVFCVPFKQPSFDNFIYIIFNASSSIRAFFSISAQSHSSTNCNLRRIGIFFVAAGFEVAKFVEIHSPTINKLLKKRFYYIQRYTSMSHVWFYRLVYALFIGSVGQDWS